MLRAILIALTASLATAAPAQTQDPPRDAQHPARLVPIRYATGGVAVPGRLFVAAGAGTHPIVLLLHGFPGTELNLDLARALQRAGWNVLTIHYRGVWGSPGQFSFAHTIEDAHAALAWLRSPAAAPYGIDTGHIVALGHSMGGFDTVMLGDDPALAGYVLIAPADMLTHASSSNFTTEAADDISYTNSTGPALTAEARAHAGDWNWARRAAQMAGRPVLLLTADDGLAPEGDAAAAAVAAAHGPKPTVIHMTTDHSFNDHRLALATAVVDWLKAKFPAQ